MPERIDLDSQLAPARQAIDANWSKNKKTLVGAGAGAIVVIALGVGVWLFLDSRPPALPKTADEAIAVLQSAKFEKLPPQRQRQYAAEARRLFGEMPEDERRELRASEETRQALRAMFQQTRDEFVLTFARADNMQDAIEQMGFGGGRGFGGRPRGEGGRGDRQGGEGGGGEGRPGRGEGGEGRPSRDDRQARMRERMSQFLREGNAQMGALMGEMRKRMQAEGGGARGGGGGGQRRS